MLTPGTVVRVPVQFKDGQPKWLVVIDLDSSVHCLVVNTRINRLFASNIFIDSYVAFDKASNPFLDYNCWIDCNKVTRLSATDVSREIAADSGCLKGTISDGVRAAIIQAMTISPGLAPSEKDRYCAALAI